MTVTNDKHDVTEPQPRKLRRELFSALIHRLGWSCRGRG